MSYEEDLRRGMAVIGDPRDGMDLDNAMDPAPKVHERNLAHLRAYVDARRVAAHTACAEQPMCNGVAYVRAMRERRRTPGYTESLVQSAVAELDECNRVLDQQAARIARMDGEIADLHGNLADTERQLAEARAALAHCETLAADARVYVLPGQEK